VPPVAGIAQAPACRNERATQPAPVGTVRLMVGMKGR